MTFHIGEALFSRPAQEPRHLSVGVSLNQAGAQGQKLVERASTELQAFLAHDSHAHLVDAAVTEIQQAVPPPSSPIMK